MTPKEVIAGIMERIVDKPGHNMLAHEIIKKLDAAGYIIAPKGCQWPSCGLNLEKHSFCRPECIDA